MSWQRRRTDRKRRRFSVELLEDRVLLAGAAASSISIRILGDVPYSQGEYSALEADLANVGPTDEFFVHLGDIQSQGACVASTYSNVANSLQTSSIPVFIIPGDNEYNDCFNPNLAWTYWDSNLMRLEENWSHSLTVMRQPSREENFAFVHSGVLFIGINLVGGRVHSSSEWLQRMTDDANWVNENFNNFGSQVTSALVFGHAFPDPTGGDREEFGQDFVTAAQNFGKPILYAMGDGHSPVLDNPYNDAPNVTRIQVNQGVPSVRVTISDDSTAPFTFSSPDAPATNHSPVLAAIGNKSVDKGSLLTFTASATDPDLPGDNLCFSLDAGAPLGASIDPITGQFSWTPSEGTLPGNHTVTVRVTDDGTPTLDDFETINITVDEVNQSPVLAAIGNKSVDEGSLLTFTASATDPDLPANDLSFSLDVGAPLGATIHPNTGQFSWTPPKGTSPGNHTVTVRVSDDGVPSLDDFETITITVNDVNLPPVLAAIGNKSGEEGSLLTFTASATDADLPTDNLSFSLDSGAPAGATIHSTTGEFRWTPTEAQSPAVYAVTVRVTDDGVPSLDDFETFNITVGLNQAPELAAIGNKSVEEGSLLTFTASATDPNLPAESLSFSLDAGAPAGATIDPSTGQFSWTPPEGTSPGNRMVTVRVSDDGVPSLDDFETITITVNDVNLPPVLAGIARKALRKVARLLSLPRRPIRTCLPITFRSAWTPARRLGRPSIRLPVISTGRLVKGRVPLCTP